MNGEVGITSPILTQEVLPQGQPIQKGCEDPKSTEPNDPIGANMMKIYQFLVYLAPNPFQVANQTGEDLFNSTGCSICHLPSYTTGSKVSVWKTWVPQTVIFSKALSNQTVMLYSDLLLHSMGDLGDGFPSLDGNGNPTLPNAATGSQFRTTPLWGLSTRKAYMHDGRAATIPEAIADHDLGTGSEAHQVIQNFNALSPSDQMAIQQFIGSL